MSIRFVIAVVAFATLLASGCSTACRSYCDKANKCPGAFPESCEALCVQQEDDASHANCRSQYDAFSDCRNNAMDVCTDSPDARCSMQANAYEMCVNAYCAMHPTDSVCRSALP